MNYSISRIHLWHFYFIKNIYFFPNSCFGIFSAYLVLSFFLWLGILISSSTSLNSSTFILQYHFTSRTVIILTQYLDFNEKWKNISPRPTIWCHLIVDFKDEEPWLRETTLQTVKGKSHHQPSVGTTQSLSSIPKAEFSTLFMIP